MNFVISLLEVEDNYSSVNRVGTELLYLGRKLHGCRSLEYRLWMKVMRREDVFARYLESVFRNPLSENKDGLWESLISDDAKSDLDLIGLESLLEIVVLDEVKLARLDRW